MFSVSFNYENMRYIERGERKDLIVYSIRNSINVPIYAHNIKNTFSKFYSTRSVMKIHKQIHVGYLSWESPINTFIKSRGIRV